MHQFVDEVLDTVERCICCEGCQVVGCKAVAGRRNLHIKSTLAAQRHQDGFTLSLVLYLPLTMPTSYTTTSCSSTASASGASSSSSSSSMVVV